MPPRALPALSPYPYAMQAGGAQEPKPNIEMSLREHLLAAGAGQPTAPQPNQQHPQPLGPHQAIDPAIAGTQYQMSAGDSGDGHLSEGGRKGRRELSTSKRAAQNRAAQRAFRQRKEEYIKQLKDQVKEFEQLCEMYKTLQTENYQLRDYIINLQSRLLETQGEIPPAPAGVDLSRSHGEPPAQQQQPPHPQQNQVSEGQAQQGSAATGGLSEREIGELQAAAAQAAAAAGQGEHGHGHGHGQNVNSGKHHHEEAQYLPASQYLDKRQKLEEAPAGPMPGQVPTTNENGA